MAKAAPKKNLSVIKRARQAEKRNLRNKSARSRVKTMGKKVSAAVEAKDRDHVEKALRLAVKTISSAVSKGAIHANTASRNISKLSKLADKVLKAGAA